MEESLCWQCERGQIQVMVMAVGVQYTWGWILASPFTGWVILGEFRLVGLQVEDLNDT